MQRCEFKFIAGLLVAVAAFHSLAPAPQAQAAETVASVQNYSRVDPAVAIGGAVSPEAFRELKRLGFKAVINLRRPDEPNADVQGEGEAVRSAGLRYINLPFRVGSPDAPALVRDFLKLVVDKSNQPVLVHSARAHRAVGLLMIKRVLTDGWAIPKALAEADALALADGTPGAASARRFGLSYIQAQSR